MAGFLAVGLKDVRLEAFKKLRSDTCVTLSCAEVKNFICNVEIQDLHNLRERTNVAIGGGFYDRAHLGIVRLSISWLPSNGERSNLFNLKQNLFIFYIFWNESE